MSEADGNRRKSDGLSERKKNILKRIIDSYIKTGEPVGSKYLAAESGVELSSATIRNEMSALEEQGYLEQPHTSAGRVPTPLGYRTYINDLMEQYRLSIEELSVLDGVLEQRLTQSSALLEEASRVIGEVTNYTSFAFYGDSENIAERFETLYIDDTSFLLIMICREGLIRNRHVKTKEPVTKECLETAAKAMNACLTGISADQINLQVMMEFESKMGQYKSFASVILRVIYEMMGSFDSERVHIEGVTKLLSYPEFSNVTKAQSVISLLEERRRFAKVFKNAKPGQTSVLISDEDDSDLAVPDTGFVYHPITVGGKVVGAIGVIGPKRMDYKKVIASLDYFVSAMSETLNMNTEETETLPERKPPQLKSKPD